MTVKQVIIGTAVGASVVGFAVLRICKQKMAPESPTQVASIKTTPVHKKHPRTAETEATGSKLVG